MIVFGTRYQSIRSLHIFPLLKYSVAEGKLEYNTIKGRILNAKAAVVLAKAHSYELYFDEEEIFKALLGEIELFYTRTLAQYVNLKRATDYNTQDWNYVTSYYFSFFALNTCMRLNHRGSTFIGDELANLLTNFIQIMSGETVKLLPGNYTFKLKRESNSSDIVLVLSKSPYGAHEQSWISAFEFLRELINIDSTVDDEYTILKQVIEMAHIYRPTFPSKLRNNINYNPQYGLFSIKEQLISIRPLEKLSNMVHEVISFQEKDGIANEMKASITYGQYFFVLAAKLYEEYRERGQACPILQKTRDDFLKRNNINALSYPLSI